METTFEIGMMVNVARLVRDWGGESPCKVVKVVLVNNECECDSDYPYRYKPPNQPTVHRRDCNFVNAKQVGHHQLVTVQTPKGEVQLSGSLLVIA